MNNRYIGAIFIAPLLLFVFAGGVWLEFLTIALSVLGIYEFFKAVKMKGYKPIYPVAYLLLALYYSFNNNIEYLMYFLIIAIFIMLCIPVINLKYTFIDVALTLLGFIYAGVFFSFIYLVSEKQGGQYLVWLIFIASWMCDTTAYYCGRCFGKHKLCPKVSPKKTIEGSLGGLIGASVSCGVFGIIFGAAIPAMAIYHYFIIGAICGVFTQFGDLVASSIKRYVGLKDYSNLIPGHGGILDRFDSILFAGVIVFYYLTFIVGV